MSPIPLISSSKIQAFILRSIDEYRTKVPACFWLLAMLPMVLCWSACQSWQDPTLTCPSRSLAELDRLSQTDVQLDALADWPNRQQLDSLLVWTSLLKNYAEEEAFLYAQEASNLATAQNESRYQGMARYYLALLEGRQQLYREGMADPMANARISREIWEETDNFYWQANVYQLIGDLYYRKRLDDSASFYFVKGLEKLEELGDKDANYYGLKGSIYHGQGLLTVNAKDFVATDSLFALANFYYLKAEDKTALASLNQVRATVEMTKGNLKAAAQLMQDNIAEAATTGNVYDLYNAHVKLGNLYSKEYRATKDTAYFNKSEREFRIGLSIQKDNFYYTYRLLAGLMQSRANRDETRLDYVDSALVYFDLALVNAREEGALDYFRIVSRKISQLCDWYEEEEGKTLKCADILGRPAFDYLYTNYAGVVDTITQDLAEANTNYSSFREQLQAVKNEQRIRNLRYLSIGVLLVAGLLFLLGFQRQKNKRLAARMEALRAQINPHFFSNSLNAIESLVNLNQRKAASKYLIHFSRLTRRILNSSMEATTTLAGELETTKHFLLLEQLRFKDKLHFDFDIGEGVNPALVEVPSLVFQPYLENSIWHGIKPKTDPSLLQIRIRKDGKKLVCEIEDDGIGRAAAAKQQANTLLQKKSVGMKITRERLQRFGGGKVEVVDLFDEDGQASGTKVILRLPFKQT